MIPDEETLTEAYRRELQSAWLRDRFDELLEASYKAVEGLDIPTDLRKRVSAALDEDPELAWNQAVRSIAAGGERGAGAMTLASAALAYSERLAWAVLPLRGKVPAIPKGRGYLDATTDPATISRWWREYPDANVGVSCIGSNLVVLDVDPRHGGDRTLAELEERHGNLPPTIRQVTGSGGQHILFRPVGDSPPGSLGKGIDVKWRGHIVTAPSVHPDTGRRYAWLPDLHPLRTPIAEMPAWLAELLSPPATAACRAPASGYRRRERRLGSVPGLFSRRPAERLREHSQCADRSTGRHLNTRGFQYRHPGRRRRDAAQPGHRHARRRRPANGQCARPPAMDQARDSRKGRALTLRRRALPAQGRGMTIHDFEERLRAADKASALHQLGDPKPLPEGLPSVEPFDPACCRRDSGRGSWTSPSGCSVRRTSLPLPSSSPSVRRLADDAEYGRSGLTTGRWCQTSGAPDGTEGAPNIRLGRATLSRASSPTQPADAVLCRRLWTKAACELKAKGRDQAYRLQRDCLPAAAAMELRGVALDLDAHAALCDAWALDLADARRAWVEATGTPPPSKPAEAARYLEKALPEGQLSRWPRTSTGGLSTAADQLAKVAHLPAIRPLLRIKKCEKLLSAFGPKLRRLINPETGRLHPHYNVAGTKAGPLERVRPEHSAAAA